MTTTGTLADRVRRRLLGQREVGLDRETVTPRVRLGRAAADAEDASWPHNVADLNPVAAKLSDEAKKALGVAIHQQDPATRKEAL